MGELDIHLLNEDPTGQVSSISFVCQYCVADAGLCRFACMESLRTKWCTTSYEASYFRRYRPDVEFLREHETVRRAELDSSLAGLYARRAVVKQVDCRNRNRYGDFYLRSWQIHDEIFYK